MKPIRLKGKALGELRHSVYERDKGQCQDCHVPVIEESGRWQSAHLAHIKSRGAGGSDTPDNVRILCLFCHMKEHNQKSVAHV